MTSKTKLNFSNVGKVVCVGRNYAAHAQELNNPIPKTPLLFIKPSSSLADLSKPIEIPKHQGAVHFELELAVLIGKNLDNPNTDQAFAAIKGLGLALDLTLRDLQSELKQKGHPWERAKAFKGACPVSEFLSLPELGVNQAQDLENLEFSLNLNHQPQQLGHTKHMLFSIIELIQNASQAFGLKQGDILLTGTPEGVGELHQGHELECDLGGALVINTYVR